MCMRRFVTCNVEYVTAFLSDLHNHVKGVHFKITNFKCEELWGKDIVHICSFCPPFHKQTFCVLPQNRAKCSSHIVQKFLKEVQQMILLQVHLSMIHFEWSTSWKNFEWCHIVYFEWSLEPPLKIIIWWYYESPFALHWCRRNLNAREHLAFLGHGWSLLCPIS